MGICGEIVANDAADRLWDALGEPQDEAVTDEPPPEDDGAAGVEATDDATPDDPGEEEYEAGEEYDDEAEDDLDEDAEEAPPRRQVQQQRPAPKKPNLLQRAVAKVRGKPTVNAEEIMLGPIVNCGAATECIRQAVVAAKEAAENGHFNYVMKRFQSNGYIVRSRPVSSGQIRLQINHKLIGSQPVFRTLSLAEINKISSIPPNAATLRSVAQTTLPADPRRLRLPDVQFADDGFLDVTDRDIRRREEAEDKEGIDMETGARVRLKRERDV